MTWTRLARVAEASIVIPRPAIVVSVTTPIVSAAVVVSSRNSWSMLPAPASSDMNASISARLPPMPLTVELIRTVSLPPMVWTVSRPLTDRMMTRSSPLPVVRSVGRTGPPWVSLIV